jgi:hypothetical protein
MVQIKELNFLPGMPAAGVSDVLTSHLRPPIHTP